MTQNDKNLLQGAFFFHNRVARRTRLCAIIIIIISEYLQVIWSRNAVFQIKYELHI